MNIVCQRHTRNACAQLLGHANQPLHQIQRMKRLVDQNATTLSLPFSAPRARSIVIRISVPRDACRATQAIFALQICLDGTVGGIVSVLMTNTELRTTILLCLQDARDVLFSDAQRLFTKHVDITRECVNDHLSMQIMRSTNVYHVDLLTVQHLHIVGIVLLPRCVLQHCGITIAYGNNGMPLVCKHLSVQLGNISIAYNRRSHVAAPFIYCQTCLRYPQWRRHRSPSSWNLPRAPAAHADNDPRRQAG